VNAIESNSDVDLVAGTVNDVERFFSYFDRPEADKFPINLK